MAAIISAASGVWSATATWTGSVVPGEGDTVQIASGHTVTIDQTVIVGADSATPALDILAGGKVDWDGLTSDTITFKGDLYVRGTLDIAATADVTKVFTMKLNYSASLAAVKYGLYIVAGAVFKLQGFNKTRPWDTLSADALAAQNQAVTTNDNSAIWYSADEVALGSMSTAYTTGAEARTISSFSTTTITLNSNLTYKHEQNVAICNLSRNIEITAHSTSHRGFINNAITVDGDFDCDWVRFNYLGSSTNGKYGIQWASASVRGDIDNCVIMNDGYYCTSLGVSLDYTTFTGNINYAGVWGYQGLANKTLKDCVSIKVGSASHWQPNNMTIDGGHLCNSIGMATPSIKTTLLNTVRLYGNRGDAAGIYGSIRTNVPIVDTASTKVFLDGSGWGLSCSGALSNLAGEWTFGSQVAQTRADIYLDLSTFLSLNNSQTTIATLTNERASTFNGKLSVRDLNNLHRTWKLEGSYEKQATVKYGGAFALEMKPIDASNELKAEATTPATLGQTVVFSCYCRKDVSMATLPYIRLSGCGVTENTATMTNVQDTWVLLTVSGVATENGYCKVEFVCQNASGSVFFDDDPDSFALWFWGDIRSVPKPTLTATDIWNANLSAYTGETAGNKLKTVDRNVKSIL